MLFSMIQLWLQYSIPTPLKWWNTNMLAINKIVLKKLMVFRDLDVVHRMFLEIKTSWLKICLLYGVLTQRPSTLKICYVNISGVYNKQLNMAKVVYLHDVLSFISKRNCFMKLWWHALLLMWYLNLSRMVGYMRVLFCSYI